MIENEKEYWQDKFLLCISFSTDLCIYGSEVWIKYELTIRQILDKFNTRI